MLRVNWGYIKVIVLLGLVVFLYAFSIQKNATRKVSEPSINFVGDNNMFITHENVSKLLIVNQQPVEKTSKEILDLNELEFALNSNPMIQSAQVYLEIDGTLNADIVQKKPIARVSTNANYYIDSFGKYMPLSTNYSARVPLVTGVIEKNNLFNVFTVANKIIHDEFLKKNVVEIHQNQDRSIYLKLRQCRFKVQLGNIKQLDKKINNLKVFYQKALKEKTLNNYNKINLQFGNQVVCTKI